jgi:hypothetical protein
VLPSLASSPAGSSHGVAKSSATATPSHSPSGGVAEASSTVASSPGASGGVGLMAATAPIPAPSIGASVGVATVNASSSVTPIRATSHGARDGATKAKAPPTVVPSSPATLVPSPATSDEVAHMAATAPPSHGPSHVAPTATSTVAPRPGASDGVEKMAASFLPSSDVSDGVAKATAPSSVAPSGGASDGGTKMVVTFPPSIRASHCEIDGVAKAMARTGTASLPPADVHMADPTPSSPPPVIVSQSHPSTPDQIHEPLEHTVEMEMRPLLRYRSICVVCDLVKPWGHLILCPFIED